MNKRPHCHCGRFTPKDDGEYLDQCSEECWEDANRNDDPDWLE